MEITIRPIIGHDTERQPEATPANAPGVVLHLSPEEAQRVLAVRGEPIGEIQISRAGLRAYLVNGAEDRGGVPFRAFATLTENDLRREAFLENWIAQGCPRIWRTARFQFPRDRVAPWKQQVIRLFADENICSTGMIMIVEELADMGPEAPTELPPRLRLFAAPILASFGVRINDFPPDIRPLVESIVAGNADSAPENPPSFASFMTELIGGVLSSGGPVVVRSERRGPGTSLADVFGLPTPRDGQVMFLSDEGYALSMPVELVVEGQEQDGRFGGTPQMSRARESDPIITLTADERAQLTQHTVDAAANVVLVPKQWLNQFAHVEIRAEICDSVERRVITGSLDERAVIAAWLAAGAPENWQQ